MIWLEVLSRLPCDWSAGFRDRVRYSSAGEKGGGAAEGGGKEHQVRRPYHPDVHLLRIINSSEKSGETSFSRALATNLSSLLFHGTCRASCLYVRNIPRPGQAAADIHHTALSGVSPISPRP
jgi:hypothetical protein